MADTYWAEREGARWDVYSKQRGWMAHADTEDDARLIVAGLEALQAPPAAVPAGYALVPVERVQHVIDILAERAHLNNARSPAHNARLLLEATLAAALAANKENDP